MKGSLHNYMKFQVPHEVAFYLIPGEKLDELGFRPNVEALKYMQKQPLENVP